MSVSLAQAKAIAKKAAASNDNLQSVIDDLKEEIQASTETLTGEIEAIEGAVADLTDKVTEIDTSVESLKEEVAALKEEGESEDVGEVQETLSLHDHKIKAIEHHNKIQDICIEGLFNENADGRTTITSTETSLLLPKSKQGIATIDKIVGKTQVVNGTLQSTFESNLVTQDMVDANLEKAENLGKYKVSVGIYSNLYTPEEFLAERKQT